MPPLQAARSAPLVYSLCWFSRKQETAKFALESIRRWWRRLGHDSPENCWWTVSFLQRCVRKWELVTSVLRPPGRKENLQWVMENLLCFAYLLTLIPEQHHVTGLTPAGQGRALAVRRPGKSKDLARLEICQLPRRTAINGLAPQV
jgi:hypothetical protein